MQHDVLTDWEKSALKVTAGLLVRKVGGFDVAELIAGRGRAQLHAYGDMANPAFMPVDVVVRLERFWVEHGGEPIVSPLMARQVGYLQVPVPTSEGELNAELARLLRDAADLAARHIEAQADGALCARDRAALSEAVDRVLGLCMRLRGLLGAPLPAARAAATSAMAL